MWRVSYYCFLKTGSSVESHCCCVSFIAFLFFFFFLRMNKNSVIDFAYLDHTEGPASRFSLRTPMDRPPRSPKLVQSSELRFARVNLAPPAARSKSAACTSLPPFELVKGEIMV
jgi:hypothetical protein